jgi:hypothetical protein
MTEEVQTQQPTAEQVAQPENQQQPSTDLNVNDLAALRNIVDVASQRGAFKASELEMVGKVYNKLNSFLETVGKKQEA